MIKPITADRALRIEDGLIAGEETLDTKTFRGKEELETENASLRERLNRLSNILGNAARELKQNSN